MLTKMLEKRQQQLRDKNAGLTQPTLVYASQLEPAMLKALTACRDADREMIAALASAIPTAIRFTQSVITAEDSSSEDRIRAADTIFFLMNALQRADVRRRQFEAKKALAAKNRVHHEARKARAVADAAQVPLIIDKKRKAIDRKLKRALKEVATQQNIGGINAKS
jgi:hypothetical protein